MISNKKNDTLPDLIENFRKAVNANENAEELFAFHEKNKSITEKFVRNYQK